MASCACNFSDRNQFKGLEDTETDAVATIAWNRHMHFLQTLHDETHDKGAIHVCRKYVQGA